MSYRPVPAALAALALVVASLPIPAGAAPPNDCDKCFARVNSDGTLGAKRNVTSNLKLGPGAYEIVFNYPVNKCYVSTQVESRALTGTVVRQSLRGNPPKRLVDIFFFDRNGSPADTPFGIYVLC
jgi:hypothetical protein